MTNSRIHKAMPSIVQKTLKEKIECRGVGLHSGAPATLTLHPAGIGHGIVFRRTDVAETDSVIPARWDLVVDTKLCTRLANESGVSVSTVEHLMAALAGSEIDNVLIDIDGPEVPIMDGSSQPFVTLIKCAGIADQEAPRRALRILRPVEIDDGVRRIRLSPSDHLSIAFEIEFDSPAITEKHLDVKLVNGTFNDTISGARTFGFAEDIDRLRSIGLARGGSLDNAVVVDGGRILNDGGLRFDDEFVRHKVLDCVGDLYLGGAPILGRVEAVRSGHQMNNDILRALFSEDGACEWVDLSEVIFEEEALPAIA